MAKQKPDPLPPDTEPPVERQVAEPRDGHMVDPQPVPVGVDRPRWKFSHNNAPEIIVEATSQAEAERLGREQTGSLDSPHPVRTWPA